MTLKGAKPSELARAVKHSMVVIDAEKHKLDYRQSEIDNNIAALKSRYQGRIENDTYHEGSSTLISRAKSEVEVLKRKGSPHINTPGNKYYDPSKPEGSLIYKSVTETYTDKNGKTKIRTQTSTRMAETNDAYTLISEARTPQELLYADYANKMKSLANQARKSIVSTPNLKYSSTAKRTYQKEFDSLSAQLNVALKNAPKERKAMLIATSAIEAKKQSYKDLTKSEIKKDKSTRNDKS